jgi:plasmid stability protein
MTRLTVELPEELERLLRQRAAQSGLGSLQDYVRELFAADTAGIDPGAPATQSFASRDELEETLLSRVDDARPGIEANADFWLKLKHRAAGEGGGRP